MLFIGLPCEIEELGDTELTCFTPKPRQYPNVPGTRIGGFMGKSFTYMYNISSINRLTLHCIRKSYYIIIFTGTRGVKLLLGSGNRGLAASDAENLTEDNAEVVEDLESFGFV